jgi:S-adenosylmethionine-diacylglycerol 3-amino-3-carboxypropyl transferase
MSDGQLNDLWTEITRTSAEGAVVIFRTAAEASILEGRVSQALLAQWHYDADKSQALNLKDRSAIYGGFHIYRKTA